MNNAKDDCTQHSSLWTQFSLSLWAAPAWRIGLGSTFSSQPDLSHSAQDCCSVDDDPDPLLWKPHRPQQSYEAKVMSKSNSLPLGSQLSMRPNGWPGCRVLKVSSSSCALDPSLQNQRAGDSRRSREESWTSPTYAMGTHGEGMYQSRRAPKTSFKLRGHLFN